MSENWIWWRAKTIFMSCIYAIIYTKTCLNYLQLFSTQGYQVLMHVVCWLQLIAVNWSSVNSSVLIALWSECGEHISVLLLCLAFVEVHKQLYLLLLFTTIGWQWLFYMYTKYESGYYFTCIQNIKIVTTKFKSGGPHEKHVVATWNLGNHLSICF